MCQCQEAGRRCSSWFSDRSSKPAKSVARPAKLIRFDKNRPADANRDQLFLAAPGAGHPLQLVADMGDGLQHVEGDPRDRRVADRAAELALRIS